MAAPRKFDEETRARAVGMYRDRLEQGDSKLQARKDIGVLFGHQPGEYPELGRGTGTGE